MPNDVDRPEGHRPSVRLRVGAHGGGQKASSGAEAGLDRRWRAAGGVARANEHGHDDEGQESRKNGSGRVLAYHLWVPMMSFEMDCSRKTAQMKERAGPMCVTWRTVRPFDPSLSTCRCVFTFKKSGHGPRPR